MPQVKGAQEDEHIVLIAGGANEPSVWGTPSQTLRAVGQRLSEALETTLEASRQYLTPAFPEGAGPDFVNVAFACRTSQEPQAILDLLHRLEAAAGRRRTTRWAQRPLDLDLIACGDRVLPDRPAHDRWRRLAAADQAVLTPDTLILPHPRLQDRSFVLVPLAEVAPDWIHPTLGLSVAQLCAARPDDERASVRLLETAAFSLVNPPISK